LSAYPLKELIQRAEEAGSTDAFASIPGIGPEKSASFIRWFQEEGNRHRVDNLLKEVQVIQNSTTDTGGRCKDMTFVITGDVHHYKNRNELKAYIESQGGKVTGSVSKLTNYLINNDIASTSGKNKKAQELHIPILSEDDFIERFGKDPASGEGKERSLFE
jgi:DNA ligase (NAD+)